CRSSRRCSQRQPPSPWGPDHHRPAGPDPVRADRGNRPRADRRTGLVTFAIVSAVTLGQRLSLKQQSVALEAFNQTNTARLWDTALSVLRITFTIEATAALLLFLWWWGSGRMAAAEALYKAFSMPSPPSTTPGTACSKIGRA